VFQKVLKDVKEDKLQAIVIIVVLGSREFEFEHVKPIYQFVFVPEIMIECLP
jgi:hypothetical protein